MLAMYTCQDRRTPKFQVADQGLCTLPLVSVGLG